MGKLTDVSRVKGALRIPGALGTGITVHDVRIGEIVEEVEDDILRETTLDQFEPKTYRDKIDVPNGGPGLTAVLPRFPVLSVAAITQGGVGLVEGEDYTWDPGGAIRSLSAAGFCRGRAVLDVTYVAGLVAVAGTTTSDLRKLATLWAAKQYNQEPMSGMSEISVAPTRKTVARHDFNEDAALKEINRIMARYRKPHR